MPLTKALTHHHSSPGHFAFGGLFVTQFYITMNASNFVTRSSNDVVFLCFATEAAVSRWKDVARSKHASQSTQKDNGSLPEFAVDGSAATCSQTENQKNSQWTVQFNRTQIISQLQINTSQNQLLDIVAVLLNTRCAVFNSYGCLLISLFIVLIYLL